ncbi:Thiol-disulfide isomerase or thioredoxin [Halobiforma haloterrestris]|uniref:Thiol-disulfide isomerase or thioredoxin n=1 Tax=Natronobacterium haloterrestre TaxID=148448 RepID=A0A1I1DQK7_NATHA|nr:thioredoxin-like domain-containing protein [Halobiforma haloterrestris]SFB74980.1 Thiol-disulfide isomerase or thioredoxin [Halobiforma haloterrestris]
MKRRELVAGVASAGVLGGGAAVVWRGLRSPIGGSSDRPEADAETDSSEDAEDGAIELETIEAPGSDAGTISIPTDGVALVVFFSPVCHRCRSLMPNLVDAQAQLAETYGNDEDDALTVVSVAAHQTEEQLRDWWIEHDGNWTLAYDGDRRLANEYGVASHPVLLALDDSGTVRWEDEGVLETERIVRNVERVLEAVGEESGDGTEQEEKAANETDGDD